MSGHSIRRFGCGNETIEGELADHLEQPIAGLNAFGLHDFNQGFFDESPDEIQQVLTIPVFAANGSGRRERPFAMKHGKEPKRPLLRGRQKVVAPLQSGAERLVARNRPASTGQQSEGIRQSRANLFDAEDPGVCRGEFDGQRNTVEAPANVDDARSIRRGDGEAGLNCRRALGEKANSIRPGDGFRIHGRVARR